MTEEKKQEMLKEAKERYPLGTRYIPAHLSQGDVSLYIKAEVVGEPYFEEFDIYVDTINCNYSPILWNNTSNRWARITFTPAKKENIVFKYEIEDVVDIQQGGRYSCDPNTYDGKESPTGKGLNNLTITGRKRMKDINWYSTAECANWISEEGLKLVSTKQSPQKITPIKGKFYIATCKGDFKDGNMAEDYVIEYDKESFSCYISSRYYYIPSKQFGSSGGFKNIVREATAEESAIFIPKKEGKPFKYNIGDIIDGCSGGFYASVPKEEGLQSRTNDVDWREKKIEGRTRTGNINWYRLSGCINWRTEEGIKLHVEEKKPDVKEDLLAEARRRYPIGTKYKSLITEGIKIVGSLPQMSGKDISSGGNFLYLNGKWAEIIQEQKPVEQTDSTEFPYKVGDWIKQKLGDEKWPFICQILKVEEYDGRSKKIWAKTKNGEDWFNSYWIERKATSSEIPTNIPSISLTEYNGMRVGDVLKKDDVNAWAKLPNRNNENRGVGSWYTANFDYSSDRRIEEIRKIEGVMAFKVCSTGLCIRADGYREFCQYNEKKNPPDLSDFIVGIDPYKQEGPILSSTEIVKKKVEDVSGYIQNPIILSKPKRSGIIYVNQ